MFLSKVYCLCVKSLENLDQGGPAATATKTQRSIPIPPPAIKNPVRGFSCLQIYRFFVCFMSSEVCEMVADLRQR